MDTQSSTLLLESSRPPTNILDPVTETINNRTQSADAEQDAAGLSLSGPQTESPRGSRCKCRSPSAPLVRQTTDLGCRTYLVRKRELHPVPCTPLSTLFANPPLDDTLHHTLDAKE